VCIDHAKMREREMNGERTPATTDDGLVTAWHPPNGVLILSHVATMSANAVSKLDVDLLIAGAGPAGMTAALVASLEGLDVILCEKSDQVGGTGSNLSRHALDTGQQPKPRSRF
jgi:NADPH-dependent 2,4-dienoyl-CoA reductase/sulfur reductase-like enzyme